MKQSYRRIFLPQSAARCRKPQAVTSCFPAKNVSERPDLRRTGTAGGKCLNTTKTTPISWDVHGGDLFSPSQCPTDKIHRSDFCDPSSDRHAVLRGVWYANSFVKWLRAERLIQQAARLRRAETLLRTHSTRLPVYLLHRHRRAVVGVKNTKSVWQKFCFLTPKMM